MHELHSYHIFSFPFQWQLEGNTYVQRSDFNSIYPVKNSRWKRKSTPLGDQHQVELYNEKNYFYQFVHPALYDIDNGSTTPIIRHYEREECEQNDVTYHIELANSSVIYELNVKSISLNLYSSGVGILSFYLENYRHANLDDIRMINQRGRRIYPPFIDVNKGINGTKTTELADSISISGLFGSSDAYTENFDGYDANSTWQPARFITNLLADFTNQCHWVIDPVVDDRMFVCCWIGNDEFSAKISKEGDAFMGNKEWHKILFIDGDNDPTCQNDTMLNNLLQAHTLPRWQNYGTLYGVSRHSLICLTNRDEFNMGVILPHVRTIYYRMAELCLVQRAAMLKFSSEVAQVALNEAGQYSKIVDDVSALYKSYIQYTNKIYFKEVTTQDQGIEIYKKLQEVMDIVMLVEDLDNEIEELHNYASMIEDKKRNRNLSILTTAATIIVLPSFIVSYFGIGLFEGKPEPLPSKYWLLINAALLVSAGTAFVSIRTKSKFIRVLFILITLFVLLAILFIYPIYTFNLN